VRFLSNEIETLQGRLRTSSLTRSKPTRTPREPVVKKPKPRLRDSDERARRTPRVVEKQRRETSTRSRGPAKTPPVQTTPRKPPSKQPTPAKAKSVRPSATTPKPAPQG
jgi:hypothetical protein